MDKALASAAALPGERRIAVLGDMLELGPEGPRFHREAGERAARLGFSPVVGVGELSRELAAGAAGAGAEASGCPTPPPPPMGGRARSGGATWCWSRARAG